MVKPSKFALSLTILCALRYFDVTGAAAAAAAAAELDCQRPPKLVDPSLCCQDGGRDAVTEKCAQRFGLSGQPPNDQRPPTIQMATCLAQCILTESSYMTQQEKLNLNTIQSDLKLKFSNDSQYAETMFEAFKKCEPNAQKKMQAFRQIPLSNIALQRGCSPFSGMVLGCAYMEYFKNCPAHRWTENADCALAKQFVVQCSLGA